MTANELADKLEKVSNDMEHSYVVNDWKLLFESALVLRKQAKEIAMLKQIIDANNLQSDIGQFVRPIDEPVAWISVLALDHIGQKFTDVRISLTKTDVADIPLYTHPAKTLTDEEIKTIYYETGDLFDFARAILKKAQEK